MVRAADYYQFVNFARRLTVDSALPSRENFDKLGGALHHHLAANRDRPCFSISYELVFSRACAG